jgi:N-methylhydantoinase B
VTKETKKENKKELDAVTLEVIRNALPAIANEMAADLQRTSYNMMIYEVRDFCCGLLDTEARMISQNKGGLPIFLADLGVFADDHVRAHVSMRAYFGRGVDHGCGMNPRRIVRR